jgi:hypothetical protein
MDYKSVIATLVNMLLAAVGTLKEFPLGVVAGLPVVFIVISILAGAIGTILAIVHFRKAWIIGLLLSIITIPALICYYTLLARGGLTLGQITAAGFLYFYIFLTLFFVLTHLENLLVKVIPPTTPNIP